MKPSSSSPESFRYDEVNHTYIVDFVPDNQLGAFYTIPNHRQHLAGKQIRVGKLLTLKRILPADAAQLREGIMAPLDKYAPRTGPEGIFRKLKTPATMQEITTSQEIDVTKFEIWEVTLPAWMIDNFDHAHY